MDRREAWAEALRTYEEWDRADWSARGGPGGGGYRDPDAAEESRRLRVHLDALVTQNGFQGTYVDPCGLSWMERRITSPTYPGDRR